MRNVKLPSGRAVPVLGQGTWQMGVDPSKRAQEIAALREGYKLGLTLIDTAEYYVGAEELIAEALGDKRKELFIVSKVEPGHANIKGTIEACEKSLKRLKTDYIDLYLLHWRGIIPLVETFEAFQKLKKSGKILDFGVSNFDVRDMEEARNINNEVAANQVLYNLSARGIEWDLIPWCRQNHIPIMAYTPLGNAGSLLQNPTLASLALKHGVTEAQIALAWVLKQTDMMAIPKAGSVKHVKANFDALNINLSEDDLKELDKAFPPPSKKVPLEFN